MSKRVILIAGILLISITSLILLNKSLKVDSFANKEEQELFTTKEKQSISQLKDKLGAKYVWFDVKTTSKKELVIQVVGDDEYFNSVKDNMATIAKSVMRTSALKHYTIVFERWDFNTDENDETFKKEKELSILGADLTESLKDYEVIRSITAKYQKSLTIETSIKGSNNEAHQLANKIEATVNEFLQLNLLSHSDSYEINILNINGKLVN
ncbi:hypothetical protein ACWV26_09790 [Rummeliibacillus sp. JY-2-4R]